MEKDQILRTSIHSRNDHTVSTCYSKNLASNIHVKLHADFQTPPKKMEKGASLPLHTSPFFSQESLVAKGFRVRIHIQLVLVS
jgi:hypothetical protein